MPFELFTSDKAVPRGEPMVTITTYGRIALNKAATFRLEKEKVQFVQLLWDSGTRQIGIRPSEKVRGAYGLSYGSNGNGAGLSSISFLNYLEYDWTETRNYSIEWNEENGMYVFELPRDLLGKPVPVSHTKTRTAGSSGKTLK